ncbi:hypothetical protein SARC_10289 [Sphaeroforma arctica JP610]|uniref:Chitinase n=1 Tax=Sphaeroforma arctica JP610 TaxID=667725 RepID=A0A0L0FKE7_9EUKA|nr:hypothetical protein SARC_10289 [Sphaeroforma arctica JP610]KNC77249.1 hypothetical protein SARC_10289 [Sphaeroforma arctica JP610]|eukprot:XP_014151151.1 hypothetical protein SARC_10289 [Sphaeroforma arctica JP610]
MHVIISIVVCMEVAAPVHALALHGSCSTGSCTCKDGYTGTQCDLAPDLCASTDCGAHGVCNLGVCTCSNNYSGLNCDSAPDLCASLDCSAHGICNVGSCSCTDGYMGTQCSVAPDLCANVFCGAYGDCDAGVCKCTVNYSGINCDIAPDLCANVDCGTHGICNTGLCICNDDYTGPLCDVVPDLCANIACGEHGTCDAGVCKCTDNYGGASCDVAPNLCIDVDCGQNGSCDAGACECTAGYTGTQCEIDSDGSDNGSTDSACGTCRGCLWVAHNACYVSTEAACNVYKDEGYTYCGETDGSVDDDDQGGDGGDQGGTPDACATVECGVNGSCDAGVCVCAQGYSGTFCSENQGGTPDICATVDCGANGSCDAGVCVCAQGYSGTFCSVADDDNNVPGSLRNLLTQTQFDEMFNLRQASGSCQDGIDKLTYENLLAAVDQYYPAFANEGSDEAKLREIAAFLGQISQEITGWWAGQQYGWGLCFISEVGCENGCSQYSDFSNTQYPPTAGRSYHGRGAIQITWNYNYGALSEVLFNGDKNVLLDNPDLLIKDGVLAFRASLWFWMTAQYPKQSSHAVMIDAAVECSSAGRYNGFGRTTNIINGGLECQMPTPQKVQNRVNYYLRYASILQVDTGQHLYCDQMINYNNMGYCSN